MTQKMTWEEMKKTFPDEWLMITGYQLNQYGEVIMGVVEQHSQEMDAIATWPRMNQPTAFRYTGESTFAGLRSHAEHDHSF